MSNHQQQAAQRVAEMINEAERAMDTAMARTSVLVTELPQLQTAAGLNASWAQPALASVCVALGEMTSARASIIAAHRSLSAIQRKLGLTLMETPNNSKDGDGPVVPKILRDAGVVRLRA